MTYKKMTVDDFKGRLKNGDYKDATGARRGAGKADLSDAEKEQCRRAIDKHFGTESAAATAPAKKQPVQKKVKAAPSKKAAKKAAAANGKAEKPNGAVKKGRPRRVEQEESVSAGATPQIRLGEQDNTLLVGLHLAKERIGTVTQAVDTMRRAKEAYPQLETGPGMRVAADVLTGIMQQVHQSLDGRMPELDPQTMATLQQTAPAAVGLPGHPSPVQMPQQPQQPVVPQGVVS